MAVVDSTVIRWSRSQSLRTNTESPTLLVVYSTNHIWYGRRIPESLRNEHRKPHTVSSLFNHIWYGRCIPKSLCYEHGKPHTVSSLFNRGTVVAFPKVYVSSTEGLAPPRGMQYG